MLETLGEMAKGAEPNEPSQLSPADYVEQKTKVAEQTKSVTETLAKIKGIETKFNEKLMEVGILVGESKKQQLSVAKLQKLSRDYEREKTNVQEVLQQASGCRDTIDYVKSEMDECEIPKTIAARANEIEQFNTKFDAI
jgi:ribosome maturation protein Sdo1